MCDACGCEDKNVTKKTETIIVKQSLLKANENISLINKKHFNDKGILAVNLMSSPGSGKTTLLERTVEALRKDMSMGVLEGDVETEIDAERIRVFPLYSSQQAGHAI